jgi:hypothetical protein
VAPFLPAKLVFLESVFHFLAGLLQVRLALVDLALGFQALIAGSLAGGFLALAAELLGGVFDLVIQTHGVSPNGLPLPAVCRQVTFSS